MVPSGRGGIYSFAVSHYGPNQVPRMSAARCPNERKWPISSVAIMNRNCKLPQITLSHQLMLTWLEITAPLKMSKLSDLYLRIKTSWQVGEGRRERRREEGGAMDRRRGKAEKEWKGRREKTPKAVNRRDRRKKVDWRGFYQRWWDYQVLKVKTK